MAAVKNKEFTLCWSLGASFDSPLQICLYLCSPRAPGGGWGLKLVSKTFVMGRSTSIWAKIIVVRINRVAIKMRRHR